MPSYSVTIPIAGHVHITVEAESVDEAKSKALQADLGANPDIEWDTLEMFNEGNICYCPEPWEIEVEEDE